MEFRTKIPLDPQKHFQIDYDSKVLLFGSCFSEHIGAKFKYFKFRALINPSGILFHPVAIEKLIDRAVNLSYYREEDLSKHKELWYSFEAHSSLNSNNKAKLQG